MGAMERRPTSLRESRGPSGTTARLNGTVFVSAARLLYVGPLVPTARHAHHAAQIVIAPAGVTIVDEADGHIRACAAVIPPRMSHGHGACDHAAILFVDGDDAMGRELSRSAQPRCETWRRDTLDVSVPRNIAREAAHALVASILSSIDLQHPQEPRHPAARRMCDFLDGEGEVDLARVSRAAGLSARQMRHAFARDVGLSMRAYLRWKRLRRAIAAVEKGASLSAAAASAGFADSAHLSRVFREMFGMTPTQGLSSLTWRTLD